ncbi:MAG TPA: hypothetical protein PKH54_09855 [Myxococcota bacterium]|nr:hypothetical protein [Myxococcota bacterium]HOA14316.1 hypothetical protein [Myxococcota bacterium]HOD00241.1 hypothetical protein [Myxococcota bacterium]HOH77551.1 hypothetical protein [Myxococcota bacterium]
MESIKNGHNNGHYGLQPDEMISAANLIPDKQDFQMPSWLGFT